MIMKRYIFCSFLLFALPLAGLTQKLSEQKIRKKAAAIHQKIFTVDTHADVPINMMEEGFDIGVEHRFEKDKSQIDIPRMQRGGMDAMFFAVYMAQGRRTPEGDAEARINALAILDKIHAAIKQYPGLLGLATTPEEGYNLEKLGKRAVFIGMENGWPIGKDIGNIKLFYDLGVRYISLSHSANNDLCDASSDADGPEHNGLSELGEKAIIEMNRLGIMADVSHLSDSSFYDIMRISKAPVIASHSSCRALADVPRNMSDDMIRELARRGGVIQINFVPAFLKKSADDQEISMKLLVKKTRQVDLTETQKKELQDELDTAKKKFIADMPTAADAVNHIEHVIGIAGIDHVGIGMDLDGGGELAELKDVSHIGVITEELVRRGYNEEQIRKIWGGNIMRVMGEVQKIAGK